jgi:hypothetical protein
MASRAKRYSDKSVPINFRIQPATRLALQKAAAKSGRTLSGECEHQLHRALLADLGSVQTHALMSMIGRTIDGFLGLRSKKTRWFDDPDLFDEAARLTAAAFELLKPRGPLSPEDEKPLGPRSAQFAIEATLREIQTADPSIPFGEQTPYQRWLTLMKEDLGPLVDRAIVWDKGAEEARKDAAEARSWRIKAAPILAEYIPLSRKDADETKTMTPAQTQRLAELRRKLAETIGGKEP